MHLIYFCSCSIMHSHNKLAQMIVSLFTLLCHISKLMGSYSYIQHICCGSIFICLSFSGLLTYNTTKKTDPRITLNCNIYHTNFIHPGYQLYHDKAKYEVLKSEVTKQKRFHRYSTTTVQHRSKKEGPGTKGWGRVNFL